MKVVSLVLILGNMKSFLWDLCFSFLKIIVKLSWGRKSWVWLEENEGTWRRFLPFPWDYWCRTWCSISGFHCKINFQMFCGCCFQSGLIFIFKMFVIFKNKFCELSAFVANSNVFITSTQKQEAEIFNEQSRAIYWWKKLNNISMTGFQPREIFSINYFWRQALYQYIIHIVYPSLRISGKMFRIILKTLNKASNTIGRFSDEYSHGGRMH